MSTPELPAGRELDALIAEKVMGVRHWPRFTGDVAGYWCANDHAGRAPSLPCWKCVIDEESPHYSTDIAAAWLVVEKMEAMGWKVTYRTTGPRPGLRRVEVEVPAPGLKGPAALYAENAETAPLAICRAALAARLPHQEDT